MKNLSDYIFEHQYDNIVLEDENNNIIVEGFWSKIGKFFGFGKTNLKSLKNEMKDWSDEFKNNFTVSQFASAKSKDKKLIKLMDEYLTQINNGRKPLLKWFKKQAETIINRSDIIKNNNTAEVYLGIIKNYNELAKNANDTDGIELAEKAADVIDKNNPKIGKIYDNDTKKLKDVANGPSDEDTTYSKEEKLDNPKAAVIDTIEQNLTLITELVKPLRPKVDGKKLMETVTNLLKKSDYLKKSKNEEISDKELSANILGMSVITCGALLMSSDETLKSICEKLGTDAGSFTKAIAADDLKINSKKKKK